MTPINGMKYLILRGGPPTRLVEVPILFPGDVDHNDVAHAVTTTFLQGYVVVGAGRVDSKTEDLKAWGGSLTIGVWSRPEDAPVIRKYLDSAERERR